MTLARLPFARAACAVALLMASESARAQMIVFDPSNYAQNVLTAARELQQVNNEIQSLENQATSLINQAKNLASLPYSSLAQLQQSITQTEQLLDPGAADRLQRHRDQPGVRPDLSAGLFEIDLIAADACGRSDPLANSLGELPGRHARAGGRCSEPRHAPALRSMLWSPRASRRPARFRPRSPATSLRPCKRHSSPTSPRCMAAIARAQSLEGARKVENQEQAQQQLANFLNYGAGYQPGAVQMFH